jgi:uncharacterized membrane protein
MSAFIGHFHPVLVHLPIGILLLAVVFDWLSYREGFASLAPAVRPAYGLGALSALLACLTGYLLALDGGYDSDTLERHRWVGIATAVFSSLRFLMGRSKAFLGLRKGMRIMPALMLLILVSVGGHLGGTLTHGSGYLLEGAPAWVRNGLGEDTAIHSAIRVADEQQAKVYDDLVAHILQEKCTGCHGTAKQKGGLRLDAADWILEGGEHGKILRAGDPGGSELYRRAMLPLEDDDHMPPKGKPQLTAAETALLEWWIRNGHDFQKKAGEIPQTEEVRMVLASFRQGGTVAKTDIATYLPPEDVEAPEESVLQALRSLGVVVMPIDPSRHYLRLNFQNLTRSADSVARLLSGIREQVLWLDLSGTDLTDAGCPSLAELKHLSRLNLSDTRITDQGLTPLTSLKELRHLNLTGTGVTAKGLRTLTPLGKLKDMYLYRTMVAPSETRALAGMFPSARLDTGNYRLPILPGDTSEVAEVPRPK